MSQMNNYIDEVDKTMKIAWRAKDCHVLFLAFYT